MSGAGEANFLYPQDPLHVEGIYNYYTEDQFCGLREAQSKMAPNPSSSNLVRLPKYVSCLGGCVVFTYPLQTSFSWKAPVMVT